MASSVKLTLPSGTWTRFVRSVRNSTRPCLESLIAFGRSSASTTVFVRGFGIRPRGPSTRPRRPTLPIISLVASATSKSRKPPSTFLIRSSPPTVVGARLLGDPRAFALGEDEHALTLAEAVRQHDRAAQLLVGVAGVEAGADVQLDGLVELGEGDLLEERDRLCRLVCLLAVDFLGAAV